MKKLLPFFILPSIAFANYVTILGENDNYFINGYIDKTITGSWTDVGNPDCNVDKVKDDYYYGVSFTQTETCTQNQERTISVEREYQDGTKKTISTKIEYQTIQLADNQYALIGEHLENSCNNIITNNYGNSDGVYKIGTLSDNFDVYCDMRGSEGWTLIAKSPGGDATGPSITKDWFINGYDTNNITNMNYAFNGGKSAIGMTKIQKIGHTGLTEFQFISEDMTQNVKFYKTASNANMNHWFKNTEPSSTTVCIDKNMTQLCESSAFENWSNRYWLRGMDLTKHGFAIIDTSVQDIHYNFPSSTTVSSTMCSVTGNLNNNAWRDSAVDGHWGNGMIVFIK